MLLEMIDPANASDEVHRRASEALDTFPFPSSPLPSAEAFHSCITRFFRHAENTMLCARTSFAGEAKMDFHRACVILKEEFGDNGLRVGTRMALYGIEGGIRSVLRVIAVRLAKELSENEIRSRIGCFWNALTVDQKFETIQEYLASVEGSLLPEDLRERGSLEIYGSFPRYFENHPETVRRLRRAVRQ